MTEVSARDWNGLAVVVINYRLPELTVRCVTSVAGDGVPPERIVVVDNGSGDGSAERIAAELPGCVHVGLKQNAGYSQAANAGAAALPGAHYLICNNDVLVHGPGSIAALLDALVADEARGIVVPRVLNEDLTLQPTVKPLDTPAVALVRASGFSRVVPNRWQPSWSTHWDHSASREIQAADGPIVLVRDRAWEQLGGYNAQIRMFAEDTDLCWRARRLGWKVWFDAGAEIVHLGKTTSQRIWSSPDRAELVGASEAALLRRQLGPAAATLSVGFTAAGLGARWLAYRLFGNEAACAVIGAELRGYASSLDGGPSRAESDPA